MAHSASASVRQASAVAPLFRGIDLCEQSLAIIAPAIDALQFRPERVRVDPAVNAAGEAYALVVAEGIPFRDAYRRVAAKLARGG